MKKKLLKVSLAAALLIIAVCGYLMFCYFTPIWDGTTVGFPISTPLHLPASDDSKPYSPTDKYVQVLGTPMPVGKHRLPVPEKYMTLAREIYLENKEIVEEMHTFIAPTYITIDFKVANNDTIVTYHGKATTKDGKSIEYNRNVVFKNVIVDFVSGYGDVPRE